MAVSINAVNGDGFGQRWTFHLREPRAALRHPQAVPAALAVMPQAYPQGRCLECGKGAQVKRYALFGSVFGDYMVVVRGEFDLAHAPKWGCFISWVGGVKY